MPFCIVWHFLFSFGELLVFVLCRVERCRHQKHEILRPKCSDEQKSLKKNLSLARAMFRFILLARQPLILLSDACIESRSVACIFTVVKKS